MAVIEDLRAELGHEREAHQQTMRELQELRSPWQYDSTLPGDRITLADRTWMALIDKDRDGLPVCCGNVSVLRDVIIGLAREGGSLTFFTEHEQRNTWHAIQGFLSSHDATPQVQEFIHAISPYIDARVREPDNLGSGPESPAHEDPLRPDVQATPGAPELGETRQQHPLAL